MEIFRVLSTNSGNSTKEKCDRIVVGFIFKKFLLSDEHHKLNHELDDPQLKVAIENLSSTWSTNSSSFSLQNIHFSAKSTDLVIIVGSIASGKVSFNVHELVISQRGLSLMTGSELLVTVDSQ